MKKSVIKIIKRKDVAERARRATAAVKGSNNTKHKTVETVNGWIFELQEKRGKEKLFSDNKILSWEHFPKTVEKDDKFSGISEQCPSNSNQST